MALAQILDGGIISSSRMAEGPEELAGHRYPQVLENLARVFLVVPGNMSVAEALRGHESVWRWVAKLAPDGDQHELAFIFVLPPNTFNGFEDALAAGLSLNRILPATTGHAVWRRSAPIQELIETLKSIRPMDLMPLKARRAADGKHSALAKLREATAQREFSAAHEAAREVLAAFSGREYLLDVFCAPPSHQNGNFLRGWLRKAVTEAVPPGAWLTQRQQVAAWLDRDLASPIQ
ncbi:MAG: hypothetical protein WCL11_04265 [Verrucomicrobiota bacterium]